jgi:hypothetical protein
MYAWLTFIFMGSNKFVVFENWLFNSFIFPYGSMLNNVTSCGSGQLGLPIHIKKIKTL